MSHEVFESVINDIFYWIVWFFELVGAVIIVIGALVGLIRYINSIIRHKQIPLKIFLANQFALGLEFMLAAEILKTVITAHRDTTEIIMLAAIVLLRAAVSVLIHWELKNEEKREEVDEKKTSKKLANKAKENA